MTFLTCAYVCATWLTSQASQPVATPQPATAVTGASAWDRSIQPKAGPEPVLRAPQPTEVVLKNGLRLWMVHKPGLPLTHVQVVVRAGSAQDPENMPGVAGFLADVLKSGSVKRTALQLSNHFENKGASFDISADEESLVLSSTLFSEHFGPVMEALADVLLRPGLRPKDIARVRKERLTSWAQLKDDPRASADITFRKTVFGNHPYAHATLGSFKALKNIQAKHLRAFMKSYVTPANTAVVVVGDLALDAVEKTTQKHWAQWKGVASTPVLPASIDENPLVAFVNKPEAPQTQLMLGHAGPARSNPDYFRLLMMNAILGGMFNSRINMNLREDKGITYGARSAFDFMRSSGLFAVSTAVRTDATFIGIEEIFREIEKIKKEPVLPEELHLAKSRYSLGLPGFFQTVGSVGSMMGNLFLYDLPLDYYQTVPAQVNAVTLDDVSKMAQTYLRPGHMHLVAVGDRNQVLPMLEKLGRGPVVERTPEGDAVH
jgi:zinc protease